MTQRDVDVILAAYEAFNNGDPDAAMHAFDPDIEWNVPPILPDAQVYHGHEGVKQFWATWRETFNDFRVVIEETLDAGERIVVMTKIIGRGRDSGIVVDTPSFAQIWTMRDGKAVHVEMKPNRREALESVGLEPPGATD
jgi:ketosteroid isomerase-like protein